MRYVKVEVVREPAPGYSLDPEGYLRVLPEIQADLPEGARAFALDDEHYNFFGSKCVKDLKLARIAVTDANEQLSLVIWFAPNRFKHDLGLVIRYSDVVELSINVTAHPRTKHIWPETRRLGDFQLDEVLPHEKGCSHEIQMTGGSIRIVSSDLLATWRNLAEATDAGPSNDGHEE